MGLVDRITIGDTISFKYKGEEYTSVISNNQSNEFGVQIYIDNYGHAFINLEDLEDISLEKEGPWHKHIDLIFVEAKAYYATLGD